jgi:hypothetical protein
MMVHPSMARRLRATGENLAWTIAGAAQDALAAAGAAVRVDAVRAALPGHRRKSERARAAADEILGSLRGRLGDVPWAAGRLIPTDGDVAVLEAGPVGGGSPAFIKVAATAAAGSGMADQQRVLEALWADERLGDWRRLVPVVIAGGTYRGLAYLVEERVLGERLDRVLAAPDTRLGALRSAMDVLAGLHAATSVRAVADSDVRAGLLGDPLDRLAEVVGSVPGLDRLALRLTTAFDDAALTLGRTHGDYWLGNILCAPGGHVTGVVDWEYSRTDDVTAIDVVNFLLTLRMWERHEEFGTVVVHVLGDERWTDEEEELLAHAVGPRLDHEVGIANVVLATWLRHVTDMLERRPTFGANPLWMRRNVRAVLAAIA